MHIPKATDDDKAVFQALVPDRADVVVRPMFGNLGAYVNGNMFMGTFGPDIGVKLAEGDRETVLGVPGAGPFGPHERPMGGYVALPHAWRSSAQAHVWVARAVDHVAAQPPKQAKPRKKT